MFIGLSVVYKLRDGWTYWAGAWLDDRGDMQKHPRRGFCWIFGIQDGRQMDYIVKKN